MKRASAARWPFTYHAWWWMVLVFGAVIALAGASARADSLVYVKGGNVWRSAPDGTRSQRLTSGGDYVSPSQADNGTIVATDERSGESCRRRIVRFSSTGKVLARLNVLGPSLPGMSALGPWYPQISPDGKRIAFGESLIDSGRWSVICEGYGTIQQEHVTVANAQTGKAIGMITAPGLTNLWTPSWLSDGRVLVFAPYTLFGFQVGYANPGQEVTQWFSDPREVPDEFMSRANISDGEIAPDGRQIAYIRGENTIAPDRLPTIEIANLNGLSVAPTVRCDVPITHPPAENPSWSPDGKSLAWSERDGIHVTRIATGAGACGASPRLVIPGGAHPDWGPYNSYGASTPGLRLDVAKSITRTTLLRSGITARATCTAACRIDSQLTVVAPRPPLIWRGTVQLRRGGTAKLQIRLTKAASRRVKRGVKLQLRIQARPGGTSTATIQVR